MARSNITDFLNNFNAAYGLTRKVSESWELGKVANEKPTERSEFTEDDGRQLTAASEVINPDTGKPYYDIQAKDGGYEVGLSEAERANGLLNGAEDQPGPGLIQPSAKKTDFLGKTYDGSLDDTKVAGLRARASADVMGKYDPTAGLKQHALIDQGERSKVTQGREDATWDQGQTAYKDNQALKTAHAKLAKAQTPEEEAAAKADLLKLPGGLDLYGQMGVTKEKIYNANRDTLYRNIAPMAERGDIDGLVKAYSHYNDGMDARRGADNSIEIFDEKTGDVVQTIQFKDNKDLTKLLYRAIYPDKAAEQDARTEAELRKQQQFRDNELYKAQVNGRGIFAQPKVGPTGTSGSATGRAPVADKPLADQAVSSLMGLLDKSSLKQIPTPSQLAGMQQNVSRMAELAIRDGKNVHPDTLAHAEFLVADGAKLTPVVNPKTGQVDMKVDLPQGGGDLTYRAGESEAKISKEEGLAAVEKALNSAATYQLDVPGIRQGVVLGGDRAKNEIAEIPLDQSKVGDFAKLVKQAAFYGGEYTRGLNTYIETQHILSGELAKNALREKRALTPEAEKMIDAQVQAGIQKDAAKFSRIMALTQRFSKAAYDPSKIRGGDKYPDYGDAAGNFTTVGY